MKTPFSLLFILFYSQVLFYTQYQPTIAESPTHHSSKVELTEQHSAKFYNERGTIKYKSKDYQGAIKEYNQAIEIEPKSFFYYNRANAKYKFGDKHGSIVDYTQSIKLNTYNIDAYFNRGSTKSDLGDHRGAIADYIKVIELNPNHTNVYYNRGNAKDKLGDHHSAILDYTKAIELDSMDADIYYNRALSLSNLGDKKSAISYYEQVLKINPEYIKARQKLDLIKSDLGYQVSSSFTANTLPLIIVVVSVSLIGILWYRKSSV